jgi:hypothetical protein
MSGLVPGEHGFHDKKQLIADLVSLNERLSRYVLRYLATDALQAESISADDERALLTGSPPSCSASATDTCAPPERGAAMTPLEQYAAIAGVPGRWRHAAPGLLGRHPDTRGPRRSEQRHRPALTVTTQHEMRRNRELWVSKWKW